VTGGDGERHPPSGWYPDSDPNQLRWWDGRRSTIEDDRARTEIGDVDTTLDFGHYALFLDATR
jgi:hypothetical protein